MVGFRARVLCFGFTVFVWGLVVETKHSRTISLQLLRLRQIEICFMLIILIFFETFSLNIQFVTVKPKRWKPHVRSKLTNHNYIKMALPERSQHSTNIMQLLFVFFDFIGSFTKTIAILCSQLTFWLVDFNRSGPV